MSFEKWIEDFDEEVGKENKKFADKYFGLGSEKVREGLLPLYTTYKAVQTNKRLVWATWVLAIITIILAISTIIFSAINYSQAEKILEMSERTADASERTANATEGISEEITGGEVVRASDVSVWVVWILIVLIIIIIATSWRIRKHKK